MSMISKAVVAGFAMFSMMFGSSNIVFPIIIGKDYTSNFVYALLGWLAATVLIPMIGYFAAMLYDADNKKYLSPLGKHLSFLVMFLLMIMMGPFGVTARNVCVSFGGVHLLSPGVSEYLFNGLYCLMAVLLAWHPGKIVQVIGAIFTPLKFGGVVIVTVAALYFGGSFADIPHSTIPAPEVIFSSFNIGYQTLDLLASILTASTIFLYLKNSLPEEKRNDKKLMIRFSIMSCVAGGIVLSIVYTGLVLIGSQYSTVLAGIPEESFFPKIAEIAMGDYASWSIAVIIAACCLAVNIILTSVFADFLHKDLFKEKFNRRVLLIITGALTFVMSLLGFKELVSIMGKILEFVYPGLIIFTFGRIIYYFARERKKQ